MSLPMWAGQTEAFEKVGDNLLETWRPDDPRRIW